MRLQLTLLGRDLVSVDLDFGLSSPTDCFVPDFVSNTDLDTEVAAEIDDVCVTDPKHFGF